MIMLGYVNTLLSPVSETALEQAITESVPQGTEKMNLDAMREGIRLAREKK